MPIEKLQESLKAFLEPITKRLPDERFRRSVSEAIVGLLGSRSPVVCAMAQIGSLQTGSAETDERLPQHIVMAQAKRIYRLLGSDRYDHRAIYAGLYEIGQRSVIEEAPDRVVIAIDPVNFEKPYTRKLEGVSKIRKSTPPGPDGQARLTPGYPAITATVVNTRVPVVTYADWFSYTTEDFYGEKEQILGAILASKKAFLRQLRRYVGDSGLDDDAIFEWMNQLGETFIFRVKHTERIVERISADGEWISSTVEAVSRSISFGPTFRVAFRHAGKQRLAWIQLGFASFRLPETQQKLWLVVAREVTKDGEEIHRLLLVTNLPIHTLEDAQSAYEDWRLRSRIEHVYRFEQEQGMDLEDVRVQTLERMRRMFALGIVAVLFVFHIKEHWPPNAVLWLRQLGGKLERSTDRDGEYILLRGLNALILTGATLAFLRQRPFPFTDDSPSELTLNHSNTYG